MIAPDDRVSRGRVKTVKTVRIVRIAKGLHRRGIVYRASHARSAIAVAPQIFPFTFGDEPVNSGEAISATCSILKGDFPMDISWAFNGEPISAESTDQFSITKGKRLSVLSIDAVAARHAGEYTCTASNKAGASSHTAALAVNGKHRAHVYTSIYATTSRLFFLRRAKEDETVPPSHHPLQPLHPRSQSFQHFLALRRVRGVR